jgi:hypothetical protein
MNLALNSACHVLLEPQQKRKVQIPFKIVKVRTFLTNKDNEAF